MLDAFHVLPNRRAAIWRKIGKGQVREDVPEAGPYRLPIRDLTIGGNIRQHREKDIAGNFYGKQPQRKSASTQSGPKRMKSAFDDAYELSELGQQFVHYAMTELPLKIEYKPTLEDVQNE